MSDSIILTKEGHDKLTKELQLLKGKKRREIANALEKARLLGDLSENAEYDAAKQSQAVNEGRIAELERKLSQARLLDYKDIPKDKVYIGARVILSDIDTKEEIEYMLVAEDETDFGQGKISISSPVGKALLGKKKGEMVNIRVPAGILKYKIMKISR